MPFSQVPLYTLQRVTTISPCHAYPSVSHGCLFLCVLTNTHPNVEGQALVSFVPSVSSSCLRNPPVGCLPVVVCATSFTAFRIHFPWLPMETEDHWLSRKLRDFSDRMGPLKHLASWAEWCLLLRLSSAQIITGELPRTYHIGQPHNFPFNMCSFFAFCSSSEP